jgi:hypothetical protein
MDLAVASRTTYVQSSTLVVYQRFDRDLNKTIRVHVYPGHQAWPMLDSGEYILS